MDAKLARRLRTRGELIAEVMERDEQTAMLLQGIRGHMAAQRSLPSRRSFFWTGFVVGLFIATVIWMLVLR